MRIGDYVLSGLIMACLILCLPVLLPAELWLRYREYRNKKRFARGKN